MPLAQNTRDDRADDPAIPSVPFSDLTASSEIIRHNVSRIERAIHAITGAFPSSMKDAESAPRAIAPIMMQMDENLNDARNRTALLADHLEAMIGSGQTAGAGAGDAKGYR